MPGSAAASLWQSFWKLFHLDRKEAHCTAALLLLQYKLIMQGCSRVASKAVDLSKFQLAKDNLYSSCCTFMLLSSQQMSQRVTIWLQLLDHLEIALTTLTETGEGYFDG